MQSVKNTYQNCTSPLCSLTSVSINIQIRYLSSGRISSNIANTLRGGFGASLRNIVCTFSNSTCKECKLSNKCAYGYLFETPIPKATQIMRKYPFAPHPFIILPSIQHSSYVDKGKTDKISVVLIGNAIKYFPYILLTFKELGKSGIGDSRVKFIVEEAITDNDENIYSCKDEVFREMDSVRTIPIEHGVPKIGIFSIKFITPLRLQVKGKISLKPEFKDIIASLSRRVQLLSYFHCGGNGQPISKFFLENASKIRLIDSNILLSSKKRFSARQKRKIPMDGLTGTLTFNGDYGTFLPLLKAGEYIHLGKDTAFGYGKYQLEEEK